MKRQLIVLLSLSVWFTSAQAEPPCKFSQAPRVFLSGEIHGTEPAIQLKNLMIQGALLKKIYLGLEIDPKSLSDSLRPENRNAIFGMDEAYSKGFGILYWSWWFSETRVVMKRLDRSALPEAISSFHYFMLINPYLQAAWPLAKADARVSQSANPFVQEFVRVIDTSLATQLPPEKADLPIPIDTERKLEATTLVIKAVLRAFVNLALQETPETAPKYIPANLSRMFEILDLPPIIEGDRNYYLLMKQLVDLGKRLKQLFVLDWRSEQMNRAILAHLCLQQAESLPNVPTVAIVGGEHLAHMQEILKANGVNASLDMQGASRTGDFEKLIEELEKVVPAPKN